MMNCNNWDKCTFVINRLSSRIKNEQNQSAMIDNCNTTTNPLCIEKSFYQCKSNVGQGCCVQVCGDCSDPIKLSDGFVKNTNIRNCGRSTIDYNINPQLSNCMPVMELDSSRHQFRLSKMFDNKRKYIDYVVTNVLRQVVNHIPIDSLHQLSCCLPQNIEEILHNVTDIDSDRLVRILVTEVLQCYGNNAGQLTDWYAFASSIKPFPLSTANEKDDDIVKANNIENKELSKSKKLHKNEKSSERLLKNQIKSIFANTPVSPMIHKEQNLESTALSKAFTPSTKANTPSINRIPSIEKTPEVISTLNNITPMSTRSKETFTPIGTKYQSRTKRNQNFLSDETDKINHESLPFRENSTNRSSTNRSQSQHRMSSEAHQRHYDHKSNKNSDPSLCSDCVLTIHHKHKHKRVNDHHHRQHNHHTTISFDTPSSESDLASILSSRSLSSHNHVSTKELIQKYKQTLVDGHPMSSYSIPTRIKSRQYISLNSANIEEIEQSKSSDLLNIEHMLLCKLLEPSKTTDKQLYHIENPSVKVSQPDATISSESSENQVSHLINEIEVHDQQSVTDSQQLQLLKNSNKFNFSSSNNTVQLNESVENGEKLIPMKKKFLRINHYPNMLADFD